MTRVLLDNVVKKYTKDFTALNSLSLSINSGEFVSILGPSGCGKTTTLKAIAGLIDVTSGHIYFDDDEVTYKSPQERGVGLVFQDYAVFPHMTVYDNISYGLRLRKLDQQTIRQRVKDVAELLGLEEVLNKKPKDMNIGELQRTSLARALVIDPRVLLLDEPLSNLDAAFRIRARLEIKRLQQVLRKTIIYVTHDQFEAMSLSDRIAVLKQGVLQQYDTPKALYEKPMNKFVAGFIGTPPLNLVEGTITVKNQAYLFDAGDLQLNLPPMDWSRTIMPPMEAYIGIRPKNIVVHKESARGRVHGKLHILEEAGSEKILTVRVGSILLRCLSNAAASFELEEDVWLDIDMRHIHVFDKRDETRLIN